GARAPRASPGPSSNLPALRGLCRNLSDNYSAVATVATGTDSLGLRTTTAPACRVQTKRTGRVTTGLRRPYPARRYSAGRSELGSRSVQSRPRSNAEENERHTHQAEVRQRQWIFA